MVGCETEAQEVFNFESYICLCVFFDVLEVVVSVYVASGLAMTDSIPNPIPLRTIFFSPLREGVGCGIADKDREGRSTIDLHHLATPRRRQCSLILSSGG